MIENIVRAVIIINDKILLARQIGDNYTFLPGGHIEFGETAETALLRELDEEIGISGKCGNFICTIENIFYDSKVRKCHEFALYYYFIPDDKFKEIDFISKEPHLEFLWVEVNELTKLNIKPDILTEILNKLQSGENTNNLYTVLEKRA